MLDGPMTQRTDTGARPRRVAGARVVIHKGELIGYLGRTGQHLLTFLPETEPERSQFTTALMNTLNETAEQGQVVYLTKVDNTTPGESDIAKALVDAGFVPFVKGYLLRAQGGPAKNYEPRD